MVGTIKPPDFPLNNQCEENVADNGVNMALLDSQCNHLAAKTLTLHELVGLPVLVGLLKDRGELTASFIRLNCSFIFD